VHNRVVFESAAGSLWRVHQGAGPEVDNYRRRPVEWCPPPPPPHHRLTDDAILTENVLSSLQAASEVCTKARDLGLIVITAGPGDVVRMVPPLNITNEDVDIAIDIMTQAFAEVLL